MKTPSTRTKAASRSKGNGQAEVEEAGRRRLVEEARELFLAHGFSKVTMDELGRQLGMSKKTMYRHFRTKDELVDAVIQSQIARIGGAVGGILRSRDDFVTKMYTLWNTLGRIVSGIGEQFREDIRRSRPDLWKRIEEARRTLILGNLSRMIDEGIQRGLVRSDVHKDAMVLIYLSAVQGIVCPRVLAEYPFSVEDAFRAIMTVYLDGILTPKARDSFHRKISSHRKGAHA